MHLPQDNFPAEIHAQADHHEQWRLKVCQEIHTIHTLGPQGTNLGAAARLWLTRRGQGGRVVLHRTVEDAALAMPDTASDALLTCAVYPDLHHLVFSNLTRFAFVDSFIFPTFPMVLASRDGLLPRTVATHPAPQGLVPTSITRVLTTSNAQAARDCLEGRTEGCITTLTALRAAGLKIVKDFGPVPMVYTLHGQVDTHDPGPSASREGT